MEFDTGLALISKGIFLDVTTALAKMFIAVFALIPNWEQSKSKLFFNCSSIRTVIETCAIVSFF